MKITDALLAEHNLFNTMLDEVGEQVARATEVGEVKAVAGLLENMLRAHADAEEQFVMVPLDHALEDKGQRSHIHQVHLEIDVRLKEVQTATRVADARRLVKGALTIIRKHFKYEEDVVFPAAEKTLSAETMIDLGRALYELRRPKRVEE